MKRGIDRKTLKLIATVAMVIDHIAWAFVPTESMLGMVMHAIGRITAPVMCYFIAEGYIHTRSLKRYFYRMIAFTAISTLPYTFFSTGELSLLPQSMIFTLTLGLLAICIYDKVKNETFKWLLILLICYVDTIGDWSVFGILFCLIFYIYRDDFRKQAIAFTLSAFGTLFLTHVSSSVSASNMTILEATIQNIWVLGLLFVLPLLKRYNGEKGTGGKYMGWFFYWFYPVHLLIIGFIKIYIMK